MQPPLVARVCAMVNVALHDAAMIAVECAQKTEGEENRTEDALVRSAMAVAVADVLTYLFPKERTEIFNTLTQHQMALKVGRPSRPADMDTGTIIGREVSKYVIAYARHDNADMAAHAPMEMPHGKGYWYGERPVLPQWGAVKTWIVEDRTAVCPPPPPAFGSTEFERALDEVRRIAQTRTSEQFRTAHRWADMPGSFTPPGHWNAIACDTLAAAGTGEIKATQLLALLNMALMDAGICCWEAKYKWCLIRPSQADMQIEPAMKVPSFPSYVSGHSSFSATAAGVLGALLPQKQQEFERAAQEASDSRLFGSLHYRFDCEEGMRLGYRIAKLAISRGKEAGWLEAWS